MREDCCGGPHIFAGKGPRMGFLGFGPLQHLLMGADVEESAEDITVKVPLPGLTKDDLDLIVGPDTLVITFKEKETEEEKEEDEFRPMWFYARRAFGRTKRIPLPTEVDPDTAKAKLENGILRVTIGKKSPGKRVDVG
nr:Hsp20/alpha crystallin family protein [Candidatus Njordarchaeota archaeon]